MVFLGKKNNGFGSRIGPWAFFLGLFIVLLSTITKQVFWMLGLLGLIVGLLNITEKELSQYLLASLTFLVSASTLSITLTKVVGNLPLVGEWLVFIDPFLVNLTLFITPGAGIVALKALYNLSKD